MIVSRDVSLCRRPQEKHLFSVCRHGSGETPVREGHVFAKLKVKFGFVCGVNHLQKASEISSILSE